MYQDSKRNKMNMIGAYLNLYYDMNYEKAAKRMTIASNIKDISKSGPSNKFFKNVPQYLLARNPMKQV